MRDLFLVVYVLGLLPVVLRWPHVGILLWAWISYMNPHRLSWGFAFDFRFAMVIGAAVIIGWLVSRERKSVPGDPITVLIIALAVWVSITTVFALAPERAEMKWDRTIKILLLTVFTIVLMQSRERLHALIWVIVLSVGYYATKGGFFTLLGGSEFRVFGPPKSFLADNNSLALAVIMVIPLMRYLQLHSAVPWIRLALLGAIPLSLLCLIGTHSRGALVGGTAMLIGLAIKSRRRGLILCIGAAAAIFALAFTPQHWIDRMKSIADYEEDSSAQGRFDAWTFAYKLSLDRPILGGGFLVQTNEELFFRYVPDSPVVRSFHSIIFEVLGEHAWIGLFLFLALLATGVIMCRMIERRTRGSPDLLWAKDLAGMLQVCFLGYFVTGLFQNLAFFDLYYHLLALVAVTYALVRKATPSPVTVRPQTAHQKALGLDAPVTEWASKPGRGAGP